MHVRVYLHPHFHAHGQIYADACLFTCMMYKYGWNNLHGNSLWRTCLKQSCSQICSSQCRFWKYSPKVYTAFCWLWRSVEIIYWSCKMSWKKEYSFCMQLAAFKRPFYYAHYSMLLLSTCSIKLDYRFAYSLGLDFRLGFVFFISWLHPFVCEGHSLLSKSTTYHIRRYCLSLIVHCKSGKWMLFPFVIATVTPLEPSTHF